MAPACEIIGFTHNAVGAPHDGMRYTGLNEQPATRAAVSLDGAMCCEWLNVPESIMFALRSALSD